jgi:hypothetical protein
MVRGDGRADRYDNMISRVFFALGVDLITFCFCHRQVIHLSAGTCCELYLTLNLSCVFKVINAFA